MAACAWATQAQACHTASLFEQHAAAHTWLRQHHTPWRCHWSLCRQEHERVHWSPRCRSSHTAAAVESAGSCRRFAGGVGCRCVHACHGTAYACWCRFLHLMACTAAALLQTWCTVWQAGVGGCIAWLQQPLTCVLGCCDAGHTPPGACSVWFSTDASIQVDQAATQILSVTLAQCHSQCATNTTCHAFNYDASASICYW
jgi:hypothetical protein